MLHVAARAELMRQLVNVLCRKISNLLNRYRRYSVASLVTRRGDVGFVIESHLSRTTGSHVNATAASWTTDISSFSFLVPLPEDTRHVPWRPSMSGKAVSLWQLLTIRWCFTSTLVVFAFRIQSRKKKLWRRYRPLCWIAKGEEALSLGRK